VSGAQTCLCIGKPKRCGRCGLVALAQAQARQARPKGRAMRGDDVLEIIGLANRYALAVDARRWALFDQVFSHDAVADFGGPARFEGLAALKRDFAAIHAPFQATQHVVTNHQVLVDGDRANCVSYVHGRFVREVPGGGPMFESGGWYDDELERGFAGWRIARRTCRTVWTAGNPAVLQTMPGVTVEQETHALHDEAAAGRLAFLRALQGG
jgi:hypothetical protein